MSESIADDIAKIYTNESRRVLATLIRLLGDFDRAEEALQEAFSAALIAWPQRGIPKNPRAWLVSTGRFKGVDAIRRQRRGSELLEQHAREEENAYAAPDVWDGDVVKDDQLRLVFTCCHPALPVDARIALTLREVCGLTTDEIAQSFLVPVETMKKRISRAKAAIRDQRIPYEVPPHAELAHRLDAVLRVIYLLYNEGYSASAGAQAQRRDLSAESVSMSRLVAELIPHPETTGLLALLLLHESRSAARTDARGDLVSLEQQDRARWDAELIAEGTELVRKSVTSGRVGPYVIQAAIASVHAVADSVASTNWNVIVGYYDLLAELQDSPVVALNRAIAVGMRDGAEAGLALVNELLETTQMSDYHRAHAARAELASRAGLIDEARESFRKALEHVRQEPERRYLKRRLDQILD